MYVPIAGAAGPLRVAVPFPLSTKVKRPGKEPLSVSVGAGKPVVVKVKLPAVPAVKVVLAALVKAGAWLTVMVTL